jgi:hypothetical protein
MGEQISCCVGLIGTTGVTEQFLRNEQRFRKRPFKISFDPVVRHNFLQVFERYSQHQHIGTERSFYCLEVTHQTLMFPYQ